MISSKKLGRSAVQHFKTNRFGWFFLVAMIAAAGIGQYWVGRNYSPCVRVDVVEVFDEQRRPFEPELHYTFTGEQAARLGEQFPGAGEWHPLGLYDQGIPRFYLTLTRKNGRKTEVWVNGDLSYWSDREGGIHDMDDDDAKALVRLIGKGNPTTQE